MSDNQDAPRQPTNMQGLLRYAIEANNQQEPVAAAAAQGTGPSSDMLHPMNEDRRRWLEDVLSTLSVNVAVVMKKAIEVLTEPGESEEIAGKKIMALDELMEWVDNMDFANDFYKIGGFKILRPCLHSPNETIRYKTAELIAELVQNNPFCQNAATESNLLPDLINLVDQDECEVVQIKALYALSSILRDQPSAVTRFTELDGFSVILRAMESHIEKLKVKAAFLLSALCTQQPSLKDVLCSMGFVEQLVALIQGEHDITHEHLLGALYALVTDNKCAIEECRRPELNLNETLTTRLKLVKGKDEFKEEQEYCEKLLECCFTVVDEEDR